MLPDRIELSTSPLPMECSTTELRQRARTIRIGQKGFHRRADPCHKAPARASGRTARRAIKNSGKLSGIRSRTCSFCVSCGPIQRQIPRAALQALAGGS